MVLVVAEYEEGCWMVSLESGGLKGKVTMIIDRVFAICKTENYILVHRISHGTSGHVKDG